MHDISCPQCEAPMVVSLFLQFVQPEDASVGIFNANYEVDVVEADCRCELTIAELDAIAEEIIDQANEANADMALDRYLDPFDYGDY